MFIDRFSKWPAASFCKHTGGETALKSLDQYIKLNGKPKTIRTDKVTAFTGQRFRDFCKKRYKLIYGTPYIHTPTGLVERRVGTLKENLLTNIKAAEQLGKALALSLDVMRKTPHTKLKKSQSAFELNYDRKPNTEVSNQLNLDNLKI